MSIVQKVSTLFQPIKMILSKQIESSAILCQSKFSFEREKGYDQILLIIRQKPQLTKLLDEKNNIISGICSCLLLSSNTLSPVSTKEKLKALMIIESCCIINPLLACTFSFSQGIPLLIKLLKSEGPEIQGQILDTLQASLLYSQNAILFSNLDGITILTQLLSVVSLKQKVNETLVLISKITKSTNPTQGGETVFDGLKV
jgi:hypothetical protein